MTGSPVLTVEEVRTAADLRARREAWQGLAETAPHAELFETPEWITAWLATYWGDRPIAFLFVRSGEDLIGVAPLLDDKAGAVGCRHCLVTPVNPHSRRCGILHRGDPTGVMSAVLEHLEQTRRGSRLRVRSGDAESPIIDAIAHRDGRTLIRHAESAPIIRLGGSWEEYLQSRPSRVRRELGRKRHKLESGWEVAWRTESTQHERAMTDVLRIERSSWKDREGTSMCSEPGAASFYERVAREHAGTGRLRIELLYLDAAPVAHIFGIVFNGVYYALKTSYDEAYHGWSPGQVLFQYVIERAFCDGLRVFDFLGSESRWKDELSNDVRRHVDACAFADDAWPCRWDASVAHHVKPLLEEHAPGVLAMRRWLIDTRRRLRL